MTIENTSTVSQPVEQATEQHLVVPTGQWRGRTVTLLSLLLIAAADQACAEDEKEPSTASAVALCVIGFLFFGAIAVGCGNAVENGPVGHDLDRCFGRLLFG